LHHRGFAGLHLRIGACFEGMCEWESGA